MMSRSFFIPKVLLISLISVSTLLSQDGSTAKKQLTFSTGYSQGTYHQMGRTLNYLPDFAFNLLESSGSQQNIRNVAEAKADIAITQLDVFLHEASLDPSLNEKIKVILPLYAEEIHLLASKKITKLREIDKIKMNIGPKGSGSNVSAQKIFKTLGFEKRAIEFDESPAAEALQMLLSGKIDLQLIIAGSPMSLLEELSEQEAANFSLLPILKKERKKLLAGNSPYRDNIIRKDVYKWLPETIRTISVDSVIIAKGNLDNETVDQLIKSVFKYKLELFLSHRKWKDLKLETAKKYLETLGNYFHPQAVKTLNGFK